MRWLELIKTKIPFAIATIGEFVALYFWLLFWDQGAHRTATIVLWTGFLTERIAVLYWVKVNFGGHIGIASDDKPWWQKLIGLTLICLSEITVWVAFVFVYDRFGIWPAFAVLFAGEQLEHSVELGLLAQSSWKKFIFSRSATMITLLEAGGGVAWLYLVRHGQPQLGGVMILMGLTIEHVVQGGAIKRKLKAEMAAASAAAASQGQTAAEQGWEPVAAET